MTTANTLDPELIDPEVLSEVRLHDGGTLLPGADAVIAQIISADPHVKSSGPAALAALVAESFEKLRARWTDPDAEPQGSKSPLRRYLRALESRGLLSEGGADGVYAQLATATASQPLHEQVRAARSFLSSREANRFLPIQHRHAAPPAERKLRSVLERHFPDQPADRRARLVELHQDITSASGRSEAEAVALMAYRLNLPESDPRHKAAMRSDGKVGYGLGAEAPTVEPAWKVDKLTDADRAMFKL